MLQVTVTTPFPQLPLTLSAASIGADSHATSDAASFVFRDSEDLCAAAAAMKASPAHVLMIISFVLRQLAAMPAASAGCTSLRFDAEATQLARASICVVGNCCSVGSPELINLAYCSGAVVSH